MAYIDLDIIGFGNYAKGLGLTIAEHPYFTGKDVTGGHSPDSWHYKKHGYSALEVQDWRPDLHPEYEGGEKLDWRKRTANMASRFASLGFLGQAIGPDQDPKGHGSHFHAGLKGKHKVPKAFLEYGFTGRWQTPDGQWRHDNPLQAFGAQPPAAGSGGSATYQPMAGYSETVEPIKRYVEEDWRADTSSADQRKAETWGSNQGLIRWAQANPELAHRELARRGLDASVVGHVRYVPEDDPKATGVFKPENRGALGGTMVGGRRP